MRRPEERAAAESIGISAPAREVSGMMGPWPPLHRNGTCLRMPELPEVAALADFLAARLAGCEVAGIQVVSFAVLKTADPPISALEGRTVSGVRRYGKFVAVEAD